MGVQSGHGQQWVAWFDTPPGRYLLNWEQSVYDAAVADVFGYRAVQLGMPTLPALRNSRMQRRWLVVPEPLPDAWLPFGVSDVLMADPAALPFPADSLDLVVMPHTLESCADPLAVLREVERVLVPEGRLLVTGMNPGSVWGWRRRLIQWQQAWGRDVSRWGPLFHAASGDFVSPHRLCDWLRVLSFEVGPLQWGGYRSPWPDAMPESARWPDVWGPRWWPQWGGVYLLAAIKRVRGMRWIGTAWHPRRVLGRPVAVSRSASCRQEWR